MDDEKQQGDVLSKRLVIVQVVCALTASMVAIAPGMNFGFSAVALPSLQNENSTFHVKPEEASWIASIAPIATPIGAVFAGSVLERLGRKTTLLIINIPGVIGWLLIAFAYGDATLILIYIGRFIAGMATGMAGVSSTVYTAEMSCTTLRGVFITWSSISMSVGILLVYSFGYFFQDDWRTVAGLAAVFPIATIICVSFLPETPTWLLSKGRTKEAENSLRRLRGVPASADMPPSVSNEFETILQKYKDKPSESEQPKKNLVKMLFSRRTLIPFIIMFTFFFCQQFSGIFVIIFYAVQIVQKAGVVWDAYLVTIIIGLTRLIVTIAMSYVSKRYGRRPPAIVSGAGMTISMCSLAVFLYLKNTHKISQEAALTWNWIPAVALIIFIFMCTVGFLTLPWAMIGEVYPSEVRGLIGGITTSSAYFFNFVVVKIYPQMLETLSDHGVFFFYGIVAAFGTVFVTMYLPETQGKSLLEIEEYFNKKKKVKGALPQSKIDGTAESNF